MMKSELISTFTPVLLKPGKPQGACSSTNCFAADSVRLNPKFY